MNDQVVAERVRRVFRAIEGIRAPFGEGARLVFNVHIGRSVLTDPCPAAGRALHALLHVEGLAPARPTATFSYAGFSRIPSTYANSWRISSAKLCAVHS